MPYQDTTFFFWNRARLLFNDADEVGHRAVPAIADLDIHQGLDLIRRAGRRRSETRSGQHFPVVIIIADRTDVADRHVHDLRVLMDHCALVRAFGHQLEYLVGAGKPRRRQSSFSSSTYACTCLSCSGAA